MIINRTIQGEGRTKQKKQDMILNSTPIPPTNPCPVNLMNSSGQSHLLLSRNLKVPSPH
jgi:hypothetical protein